MKKNINIIILFLIIMSTTSQSFCSDLFSPSIKFGINFNKMNFTKDNSSKNNEYPAGLIIGISNETIINSVFFISNEIYFKNAKSSRKYRAVITVGTNYNYNINYLRVASMIGINFFNITDLLIGLDVGKLTKVEFYIKSGFSHYDLDIINVKDYSPQFDTAICFGTSKKLETRRSKLILELKYLIGMTTYRKIPYYHGDFKFQGLNIILGFQL